VHGSLGDRETPHGRTFSRHNPTLPVVLAPVYMFQPGQIKVEVPSVYGLIVPSVVSASDRLPGLVIKESDIRDPFAG